MYKIKLKIADVIIEMKSRFFIELPQHKYSCRYENFIYRGRGKPNITIDVKLVKKLPKLEKHTKRIFSTIHPESHEINWALFKNSRHYILKTFDVALKQQCFVLNRNFNKATAYLLNRKKDGRLFLSIEDVLYDALQIILIHYLSKRGGIFVHSVGMKDRAGKGLLFAGKSGQGKSTLARIWHKHSRDQVLNDDRIIVRKINNRFFMYGSPWHGGFYDYLISRADKARIERLFFLFHSRKNQAHLLKKDSFSFLYPCLFPPSWDKKGLERTIITCQNLIDEVSCFKLGFKNTKNIINFTKNIKKGGENEKA